MTLQELWELFPIVLTPHNPQWSKQAEAEIEILSSLLGDYQPLISHIGSTAIPQIQAKPIVDLLVELPVHTDLNAIRCIMEDKDYICMAESDNRLSFNKGYTPHGYAEKVFHIHVHRCGDNDELTFRNYLLSHPESAAEYERLKLSLLPRYKNNRDAYTAAKTTFVRHIISMAKNAR